MQFPQRLDLMLHLTEYHGFSELSELPREEHNEEFGRMEDTDQAFAQSKPMFDIPY